MDSLDKRPQVWADLLLILALVRYLGLPKIRTGSSSGEDLSLQPQSVIATGDAILNDYRRSMSREV